MANSIPFDPGLVLGNLLDPARIDELEKIAEAQKPSTLANDKLNALISQNYKMKMIYSQMVTMHVSEKDLAEIEENINELRKAMVQAAIELGQTSIKTERDVMALKSAAGQTKITKNIESPIDYGKSNIDNFPLAFDSIKFDVQFFRNEFSKDDTSSHAASVTASVGASFTSASQTMSASMSVAVNHTAVTQNSHHQIEGTIVITAHCTHKRADIIDPFIIDPVKAVTAWNYTYPNDKIRVDPASMLAAALPPPKEDKKQASTQKENALHLLSGCSKGSSFVGFVHILQKEKTSSSQMSTSVATSVQASIKRDMVVSSMTGSFGLSASVGTSAKNLLSTSELENQCSIVCEGSIPSIATENVTTMVADMQPDPKEVMGGLSAIMGASDSAVNNSMEAQASDAKRANQYSKLNSENLSNTVTNIGKIQDEENKVINTNSMFTAFTDFCKEAISGEGGVPINFYIKSLTKRDVAKAYIGKFYPNGASGAQGLRGQLGQEEKQE